MSSRRPKLNNEFDELIQKTLHIRVDSQDPPERVWDQIQEELQPDSRPPAKVWLMRSSVIVQTLMVFMIVMSSGITLQMFSTDGPYQPVYTRSAQSTITQPKFEADYQPMDINTRDLAELKLLKSQQAKGLVRKPSAKNLDSQSEKLKSTGINPNNARPYSLVFETESTARLQINQITIDEIPVRHSGAYLSW